MAEWPTPRYPVTLLDELAALDPPQRREVARQLLKVAETFAVVSDGRHAAPMHWSCWSTCSIRLMGADPFLRGACGTPGMARTFGTCEGDTRDRMVRTSSGDGVGIAASSRLRAATILRWWCETAPHRVDREFHL